MGQGVAVKLQSESAHHIMAVQGAVAEVQLGGSVLRLGVTAGALVGALVVLPTRHDPNCNASP
uniref:Serine/arginine-rich protein n=1 Tax=Solanum tuberosum TaxID=4113 RepID=M1D541_SOLTU